MTDRINEQISAFLDGQLPRGEIGLLARRMERDAELRRAFGNYVLAGEVLRSPGGITASADFVARVSAAIDSSNQETAEQAPAPSRAPRWARPAFATAVAASAALAAVLLVRPDMRGGEDITAGQGTPGAAAFAAFPTGGASPTPAQSQRLAGYLVAHSQFTSPMGRRNVWSGVLAADPGIARVAYEAVEAP
jgi:sigma-E factor negative regulatory protein RseA